MIDYIFTYQEMNDRIAKYNSNKIDSYPDICLDILRRSDFICHDDKRLYVYYGKIENYPITVEIGFDERGAYFIGDSEEHILELANKPLRSFMINFNHHYHLGQIYYSFSSIEISDDIDKNKICKSSLIETIFDLYTYY